MNRLTNKTNKYISPCARIIMRCHAKIATRIFPAYHLSAKPAKGISNEGRAVGESRAWRNFAEYS